MVVDEHDPPGEDQPAEIDEVQEDAVEPVIAVDEGQIEAPALADEARQGDLRLLRVELHQLREARLLQELQAAVGEPRRLLRIEHDMTRVLRTAGEQALTDAERRDAVPEADLDRPTGVFVLHPPTERRAL